RLEALGARGRRGDRLSRLRGVGVHRVPARDREAREPAHPAARAGSPRSGAPHRVTHAEHTPVAEGVTAAVAIPDRGAVGNAAIVDLGGSALVVDTHVTPAAGRELRQAAGPVRGVLNTHWHADHVPGNGELDHSTTVSTT